MFSYVKIETGKVTATRGPHGKQLDPVPAGFVRVMDTDAPRELLGRAYEGAPDPASVSVADFGAVVPPSAEEAQTVWDEKRHAAVDILATRASARMLVTICDNFSLPKPPEVDMILAVLAADTPDSITL